ncbi:MAG: response regulator transcription factor [Candidatus Solibacter usitatus]|nr:response regulator transcription factor [Candidatus Solibacter usitatus]
MEAIKEPANGVKAHATIVADGSPLISESLAALFENFAGCSVLGHCSDGKEALEMMQRLNPDVAVLDLHLTGMETNEVLRQAQTCARGTRVIIMASRGDHRTVLDCLRSGARAFVLKSDTARHMEEAFRLVLEGSVYVSPLANWQPAALKPPGPGDNPIARLSSRERQVFLLLIEGVRARDIAAKLVLSPKTVDTYRASLMRKLDIRDVTGLVKFAIYHKITQAEA